MNEVKLDTKKIQELKKMLKATTIRVGVPEGAGGYDDGSTIAEVAFYNEFGTARIPERSFIRSTFNEQRDTFIKFMGSEAAKSLEGKQSMDTTIQRVGIKAQSEILKKFRDNDWDPNAPYTIAKKGSSTPLIDSGQLRQSITWEVKK